jgi:hypothetical protein
MHGINPVPLSLLGGLNSPKVVINSRIQQSPYPRTTPALIALVAQAGISDGFDCIGILYLFLASIPLKI